MATPVVMGQWIPAPTQIPEYVPQGLSYLMQVDGLLVTQKVEILEAVAQTAGVEYEGNNKYEIADRSGRIAYQAVEDTGFCWRCCCGSQRPFKMHIFDQSGQQTLDIVRKFPWCVCAWLPMCMEEVTVYLGKEEEGKVIGNVRQPCCGGFFTPTLLIQDAEGNTELTQEGPCIMGPCCETEFQVKGGDGSDVGVTKKLGADSAKELMKELFTDADRFTMSFPQDLKVETKATLLAALLLTDMHWFEQGGSAAADGCELFACFCCGCRWHCVIQPQQGGDGGDGGAPASEGMRR